MLRFSLLLTILSALSALLLVEAVPRGGGSRSRPSTPSRRPSVPPVRRPSTPVERPPVVVHRPSTPVHKPPVVVHRPSTPIHKPPVVVHRPTVPGQTRPPQGSPLPSQAPSSTRPGSPPNGSHSASTIASSTSSGGSPSRPTPSLTAVETAAGCHNLHTCDTCAQRGASRNVTVGTGRNAKRHLVSCGWLQTPQEDHGSCVTIMRTSRYPADALAHNREQCTDLYHAISERHVAAAAPLYWNAMARHTFFGDASGLPNNGRHLASAWVRQFPNDTNQISINEDTDFGQSPAGKTLFLDTDALPPNKGAWTQQHIRDVCITAIAASIREHAGNGRQTPQSDRSDSDYRPMKNHNAYAVRSPFGGGNLCIDVFDRHSCFPAALGFTTKRAGEKCRLGGSVLT